MFYSFAFWAMRVLEVLFFAGIAGCVLVVLISWISIFGSEFRRDNRS
jgi:hypothetical protein